MGKPITTKSAGICFAFPDVCLTPVGPSVVPIPYPNIGQLSLTEEASNNVNVAGNPVIHMGSYIPSTTGDEPGTGGGVISGVNLGLVEFKTYSNTVNVNGKGVVRMFDATGQNKAARGGAENAVGTVLAGVPTVLVGD